MAANVPDSRIRLAAAMKLYQMDELSAQEAAELGGVSLIEFLERRGEFGVRAFTQTSEELDEEIAAAAWASERG